MKYRMELKGLKWLLPVLLCLVFACSGTGRPPKDVLTHEEMVKVMIDMYLVEEKVNRLTLPRDSATEIFDSLRIRLFEKLGTQDSAFMRSLRYYTDRPKDMEFMYTALVDSLQLREQHAIGIPVK